MRVESRCGGEGERLRECLRLREYRVRVRVVRASCARAVAVAVGDSGESGGGGGLEVEELNEPLDLVQIERIVARGRRRTDGHEGAAGREERGPSTGAVQEQGPAQFALVLRDGRPPRARRPSTRSRTPLRQNALRFLLSLLYTNRHLNWKGSTYIDTG